MNRTELDALSDFLQTGIQLTAQQVPEDLASTRFLSEVHPTPTVCPRNSCDARVKQEVAAEEGFRRFICHRGCDETRSVDELTKYKIESDTILSDLCNQLGITPVGDSEDDDLPKYVSQQTEEGIEVCLIGNPHRYESTVEELIKRALKNQRVLVMLTPADSIRDIVEVSRYYPLGSLICPLPLTLLSKEQKVKSIVSNAGSARKRVEDILEEQGLSLTGTLDQLGQNPALIEAALLYLQVLREESSSSTGLGAEFEQVCKAAFASIGIATDLSFGGTADRGERLPDIVLGLDPDPTRSNEYSKALGLVDAKSGRNARFSSEKIAGKHTEYLKAARRSETYRGWHLCHIFVVFDIDGYKEIDWFDEIRDAYEGYDDDVTMVVLYADALRELVAAHRNLVEASELKRSQGNLSRVVRPLFDHQVHDADWVSADLPSMVRVSREEPTKREQRYIRDYDRRSQLLVVTADMVDSHLQAVQEDGDEYERLLEAYTD